MGNIVSDPVPNNYLKQDTEFSRVITEWAREYYDAGLSYQAGYTLKNLLKKRACCTKNQTMSISFPEIDSTKLDLTQPYDENNFIKVGYIPIKIKAFDNNIFDKNIYPKQNEIQTNYCNFVDESSSNNTQKYSYYQDVVSAPKGDKPAITAVDGCKRLYTLDGNDLCYSIKDERTRQYPKSAQTKAYGYYGEEKFDSLKILDTYVDCHCENSIMRDVMDKIKIYNNVSNANSVDTVVQSNDNYCTNCVTEGKCYVPSLQKVDALCLNYSNVGDLVAVKGSQINVGGQSCNIYTGSGSGPNDKGSSVNLDTQPSVSSIALNVPTIKDDESPSISTLITENMTIVSIITSIIVALIGVVIML